MIFPQLQLLQKQLLQLGLRTSRCVPALFPRPFKAADNQLQIQIHRGLHGRDPLLLFASFIEERQIQRRPQGRLLFGAAGKLHCKKLRQNAKGRQPHGFSSQHSHIRFCDRNQFHSLQGSVV